MKGIIKLCNRLGWKFVEKSPLRYMFPWMIVRVIYRKKES